MGAEAPGGIRRPWGGGSISFPVAGLSEALGAGGPGPAGMPGAGRGSFVSAGLRSGPADLALWRLPLGWTLRTSSGGSWVLCSPGCPWRLCPAPPGSCRPSAWRWSPQAHASPTNAPSCLIVSDAVSCRGTLSLAHVHKAGAPFPRPLPLLSGGRYFWSKARCCVAPSTLGDGVQPLPTPGTGAATAGPEPRKRAGGMCGAESMGRSPSLVLRAGRGAPAPCPPAGSVRGKDAGAGRHILSTGKSCPSQTLFSA